MSNQKTDFLLFVFCFWAQCCGAFGTCRCKAWGLALLHLMLGFYFYLFLFVFLSVPFPSPKFFPGNFQPRKGLSPVLLLTHVYTHCVCPWFFAPAAFSSFPNLQAFTVYTQFHFLVFISTVPVLEPFVSKLKNCQNFQWKPIKNISEIRAKLLDHSPYKNVLSFLLVGSTKWYI